MKIKPIQTNEYYSQAKFSWLMSPERRLIHSGEVALFRRAASSL